MQNRLNIQVKAWLTGKEVMEEYDLAPFELINFLKKGLEAKTQTGHKVIDSKSCQTIHRTIRTNDQTGRFGDQTSTTEHLDIPKGCHAINFDNFKISVLEAVYINNTDLKKLIPNYHEQEESGKVSKRRYNNTLKIVAALICHGKGPTELKSRNITSSIAKKLDELGIDLGEDTIRKIINDVNEILKHKP